MKRKREEEKNEQNDKQNDKQNDEMSEDSDNIEESDASSNDDSDDDDDDDNDDSDDDENDDSDDDSDDDDDSDSDDENSATSLPPAKAAKITAHIPEGCQSVFIARQFSLRPSKNAYFVLLSPTGLPAAGAANADDPNDETLKSDLQTLFSACGQVKSVSVVERPGRNGGKPSKSRFCGAWSAFGRARVRFSESG